MNKLNEMQTYLDDCQRLIDTTRSTLQSVNDEDLDQDEILRECQHNIRWAYQDLSKVKQYLYPEQFSPLH